MTALGTYLLVSLFFVLVTMIEFAIVLLLKTKLESNTSPRLAIQCNCDKTNGKKNTENAKTTLAWRVDDAGNHGKQIGVDTGTKQELASTNASRLTKKIDYTSLVLFNFGYCIFNFFYFLYHM
jgi:hypothetical protein